ncbi:Hypothetical predicted protein [Cloeon dipterum]|uniref:Uncharacterized protein n=1 Tax=Cloeon dipterum TaxID=197152 RepID=A0A8S1CH69_9INSE|nr:Hypothetical predicted protein [Cloeon dipterum]
MLPSLVLDRTRHLNSPTFLLSHTGIIPILTPTTIRATKQPPAAAQLVHRSSAVRVSLIRLAAVADHERLKGDMDVQPTTLEEACQVIHDLRERHRSQAHQLLSWRRRAKAQVAFCSLPTERTDAQIQVSIAPFIAAAAGALLKFSLRIDF